MKTLCEPRKLPTLDVQGSVFAGALNAVSAGLSAAVEEDHQAEDAPENA